MMVFTYVDRLPQFKVNCRISKFSHYVRSYKYGITAIPAKRKSCSKADDFDKIAKIPNEKRDDAFVVI